MPEAGVDIALVPYWYALEEGRLEEAMTVLRAKTVVLFHAALEEAESGWAEVSRGLRERYPAVRAPVVPGEVLE